MKMAAKVAALSIIGTSVLMGSIYGISYLMIEFYKLVQ